MKRVSNKFRNSLRGIRRLSAIVGYHTDDSYFILTTEDGKFLQTEDGNNLLTTETGIVEYDEGVINNVNVLFNTSLLKTTCKSVQIDCNNKIEVGTKINVRIGVYIPENDEFEYVNYGDYYIIDEPVYQADTKSYLITAYDKMVQSMVDYDSNPLSITYPITHKNLIKAICSKLGWEEELGTYDCETTEIKENIYSGQGLTYRDILDDLNGAMGGSLMFAIDNQLIRKQPTETNLIIEDDDLKDTNVDFGDKYGPVNALTISSNKDVIIDNREDSSSIQENGKTEFKLNDNLLMIKQSDDFIDDLFNKIDGLEYSIFDVSSTGILIIEPLDIFTFRHDGVDYKTIMLNDDIQLSQGLEENLYVEKPEETESEYITNDKNEKKLNNALISIDKANAEIVLKVNSDGKISQVRLDSSGEDGSLVEISGDQIDLKGKNINLTGDDITISSNKFNVDKYGNVNATNLNLTGGSVNITPSYVDDDIIKTTLGDYKTSMSPQQFIQENSTSKILLGHIANTTQQQEDYGLAIWKKGDNWSGTGINLDLRPWSNDPILRVTSNHYGYGIDAIDGYTTISDKRSKENIKDLDKKTSIDIITKLNPIEFNYKTLERKHRGLIAQDVKEILNKNGIEDEIYSYDKEEDRYSLNYEELIPDLINCIKYQQEQIEELKKEIENLKGGNK